MSAHRAKPPEGYIPTLDGWRAFAVTAVVVSHLAYSWPTPPEFGLARFFLLLMHKGMMGVDIFFGISGFLITSSLIGDVNRLGNVSIKSFYVRRAFRILPPLFPFLLTLALLSVFGVLNTSAEEISASLFFYRNFMPLSWNTAHFWSLAVEEHFYLVWPLMLSLLYVKRRSIWPIVALAIAFAIWRDVGLNIIGVYEYRTDVHFVSLLWGATAAVLYHNKNTKRVLASVLKPYLGIPLFGLAIASAWANFPMRMYLFPFLVPVLILYTVMLPKNWLHNFLEREPLRWLGRRSYSIYVWQQLAMVPFWADPTPLAIVVRLSALLGVACLSYSFLETPLTRLGHRLSKRFERRDEPTPLKAAA